MRAANAERGKISLILKATISLLHIMELGALSRYERPKPSLTDYDGLLGQEAAS